MARETFQYSSKIDALPEEVFSWHERPGAFERLTPPWENVRVIERTGGIRDGARVVLETKVGPVKQTWIVEHAGYRQGEQFRDIQIKGPFKHWEHTHRFSLEGGTDTLLEDEIEYELPSGELGRFFGGWFVRNKLKRIFRYRHETTARDIEAHQRYRSEPLTVLISGSSGFVGSELMHFLQGGGHQTYRLVRSRAKCSDRCAYWNPDKNEIELTDLPPIDAVVHLAGENVASGRWTAEKKRRIKESRAHGTRMLSEALVQLPNPPKTLVSASAIGFYGSRRDEELDETSSSGSGFLAEVCREWEAATEPARAAGIRVTNMRIGAVLSPRGGVLERMLPPFLIGAGGPLGSGEHYMSWVALDDVLDIVYCALTNETLQGPINTVSPNPLTNKAFTKVLGDVLNRPTILPAPKTALRILFGEFIDEGVLSSSRVVPKKLIDAGFSFRYPDLEDALRHVLGR